MAFDIITFLQGPRESEYRNVQYRVYPTNVREWAPSVS